jgi:DNA polymerase III epsilon subunit-like protein
MTEMPQEEAYVSVDIEASGPIPGDYSLLAIGACLVDEPDQTFYRELKPMSDRFVADALAVSHLSLDDLKRRGADPAQSMRDFSRWVQKATSARRPVFVGFNAGFDWAFINWYFHHFMVENPFGISALDIKSYYMGLAGTSWEATRSSQIPAEYRDPDRSEHTHNALQDALEQAAMFARMLHDASERR